MMKLINKVYETGECPKYFKEAALIALKKKTQAAKCSDHRAISVIAYSEDSNKDT